ncbi:MAG: DUF1385 domain-containing protein [Chloroflexi bacterium]|nr:DUF1385 domain-containing protein [Chloroflexota bacterium]
MASQRLIYYGGQAVLEGVMIRGPRSMAVACRRPDGDIAVRTEVLRGVYVGTLRRVPFLRGVITLWETLALGMRALMFSSNVALGEEDREVSPLAIWITAAMAFAFIAVLFFVGPVFVGRWLEDVFGDNATVIVLEGLIRLGLLLAYLWLIGFLPDIQRVYAYHGAEHKAIHALEAGDPLEPRAVQRHSTAHIRCGTSFLLTVVIVSLVIFVAMGNPDLWLRVVSRVALIPVIAAVSYEIIRLGGAYHDRPIVRTLMKPNLLLQKLTTREPDDAQVEVALRALQTVITAEETTAAERGRA